MAVRIKIAVYTNSDDAFVAWAPSAAIPGCRGFLLERGRKTGAGQKVEIVENRVGFKKDKPKSGDHKPSSEWPFQRFTWTDHAADVGNQVRYRVHEGPREPVDPLGEALARRRRGLLVLLQSRPGPFAVRRPVPESQEAHAGQLQGPAQEERRSEIPSLSRR